jgi:hypothetical protein
MKVEMVVFGLQDKFSIKFFEQIEQPSWVLLPFTSLWFTTTNNIISGILKLNKVFTGLWCLMPLSTILSSINITGDGH